MNSVKKPVFQEMEERLAAMDQKDIITGRTLLDEIQSLEHDLIKHALETNKRELLGLHALSAFPIRN